MSALRVMRDGRPAWLDIGPANGASGPFHVRGSHVTAEPGWRAKDRAASRERTIAAAKARLEAGAPPPTPKRRGRLYATDEERIEARRRSFREAKARARVRAKDCRTGVQNHAPSGRIVAVGVSDDHDSATMRTARLQVLTPPVAAPFVSPGVRR